MASRQTRGVPEHDEASALQNDQWPMERRGLIGLETEAQRTG